MLICNPFSYRFKFQNEKKELEEKFRKAMVANAGLDNEKSQLIYQVRRSDFGHFTPVL